MKFFVDCHPDGVKIDNSLRPELVPVILSSGSSARRTSLTDGRYAWPAILANYVERQRVRLPDDFTTHMRKNAWLVPRAIETASLKLNRNVPRA